MEELKPLFNIPVIEYGITSSILIQWIIIALLAIGCYFLTRNLKKIPDRKQTVVEMLIGTINNLVKENMGENYKSFVPYIGTLAVFLIVMNLTGLIGISPPTEDYSVAVGLAAITFFMVQATAIKHNGLGGYFKAYGKPFVPLLPLNIMERVMLPVSLSFRLFGNMTAGAVVIGMVYKALGKFAVVIPVPLHFYFDLFDGSLQMLIFVMLTMINIKIISEH